MDGITLLRVRCTALLTVVGVLLSLLLGGCGGGFDGDSENASTLRPSLFGTEEPDTTAR